MAKILLDVGAHTGETARIATLPQWGFESVYSFEPASSCWPILDELAAADPRIRVVRSALWKSDGHVELFGAGSIGASMFRSKEQAGPEVVSTVNSSSWFQEHIAADDVVFVKLNCEGAELGILENLAASGEICKIDHLVVHFDIRKVPELLGEEARLVQILNSSNVKWLCADQIFYGRDVSEKTHNWLSWCHAGPTGRLYYRRIRAIEYSIRVKIYNMRKGG